MITDTFHLNSQQTIYLDTWMNRVSRSFALVIPCLEEPLNHYLATAYLLCRVIDNIEDSLQPFTWKVERFAEIAELLERPSLASQILAGWEREAWPGLTPDEHAVMGREYGLSLWEIYALIPPEPFAIICRWTLAMVAGMRDLDDPQVPPQLLERDGFRLLGTHQDYNDYCYIVAGTVGHLATELVIQHYGLPQEVATRLLAGAEACGRGLQKTNIVKDFPEDLARGVSYLPDEWLRSADYTPLDLQGAPTAWKANVIADVLEELDDAAHYVTTIPQGATGYRQASLLCLFPAYQTLLLAAQKHTDLFTQRHRIKISHQTMETCVRDALHLTNDNTAILNYCWQLQSAIRLAMGIPSEKVNA